MFCLKCGNKLSDTDKFCQKCGTPVSSKKDTPYENKEIKIKVCSKCGNQLSDTDKFCIKCGTPMDKTTGNLERTNDPDIQKGLNPSVTPDRGNPEKSTEEKQEIIIEKPNEPIHPQGPNHSVTPDKNKTEKSHEEKSDINIERPNEPVKTPGQNQSQHIPKKKSKGLLISVIIIVILGLGIGSFYIYNLNTGINSKDYCINKLCSGSWVSDSKDVISKDTIIESILGEVEAIDNFKQQKWIFNKDFTFSMTETSSIQGSLQGYVISNHIKTDNYKGTWSLGEVIKKDNPVRLVNIIKYQSMSDTSSFVFVPQLNSNGIYTPFQLSVLDNDKDELTIPINFKNEHTDNFIYNHQIEDTSQNSDKSSNKIVSKPIKNTDTVSKPSIDTIKTTKDTSKPISVNEQSQVDVNILGKYTGKFSKTSILIVLDSISGNNVYGYDIVDNNKRNIKGPCYTNRDMFSLNLSEPGTMKTDGVFNIEIDKNSYSGDGTWKMLVGNLSIDFKLTKE